MYPADVDSLESTRDRPQTDGDTPTVPLGHLSTNPCYRRSRQPQGPDLAAPICVGAEGRGKAFPLDEERLMRDDVRQALANGRSLDLEGRTIDITTKGRRSGEPRRIEIAFFWFEDSIYLSGVPGPRIRDRLANLTAEPNFTFHLKHGVVADLPAVATVITDPAERRRVLADFVDQFNQRNGPESGWPKAVLEEWVEGSPLAKVSFLGVD